MDQDEQESYSYFTIGKLDRIVEKAGKRFGEGGMDEEGWRKDAFEVYRLAWAELQEQPKGVPQPEVEFYIDELKEALLDLKQATIADDPGRALLHLNEVSLLVAELRIRKSGEP